MRTGRPINRELQAWRNQAGLKVIYDKWMTGNTSVTFEVIDRPVIVQLFGATTDTAVVQSLIRMSGTDYPAPYMQDGAAVVLNNSITTVVLTVSGRYRLQTSLWAEGVLGIRDQAVLPYGDVAQPSGVHENNPNMFFDGVTDKSKSHIIEITDTPWVFTAYGLLFPVTVLHTFQKGNMYVEEPYTIDGVAVQITATNSAVVLDKSGRYRFDAGTFQPGMILAGNPTNVHTQAAAGGGGVPGSGTVTSVGIIGTAGVEVVAGSPITTAGNIIVGLDAATQALLATAGTALQPGAPISSLTNDADYITDAPSNGSVYGRKDGAWAQLTAGLGTVTSVGLSAPTGFTVGGSPVETAGVLALAYATGYQGYTTAEAAKLAGIQAGAQVNTVASVNAKTGTVVLNAADVGAEPAFAKGSLANGTGIIMTGVGVGRLVGAGGVSFALSSAVLNSLGLADTAVQPGDPITDLSNNAGYIGDAPSDSTIYGRQNGLWVPAPGGGGGGTGTVTSVGTGTGLTGGPITISGTIALNAASIASLAKADSALQPGAIIPAANVSGLATVATTGAYADLTGKPTIITDHELLSNLLGGDVGGHYHLTSAQHTPLTALVLASTGIVVRTATNTWAARSLTVGTGMSVTNPAGLAGNPLLELSANLQAWSAIATSAKFNTPAGTTAQYIRGDGSLATFPAIPAGTVTQVAATGSTGLTVGGSPITGAGTLTFTLSTNLQSWSGIAPSSKADASALGSYVLKAGDTMTGRLTAKGAQSEGVIANPDGGLGGIEVQSASSADAAFLAFHRPGNFAFYFGMDVDRKLKIGGWSLGAASYEIFHQGNFTPGNYLPLTGGALSGSLSVAGGLTVDGNLVTTAGNLDIGGSRTSNTTIEIGGRAGSATSTGIDFHTGATAIDYDVRILATGGNGVNGGGALSITALASTGVSINGNQITSTGVGAGTAAVTPADAFHASAAAGQQVGIRFSHGATLRGLIGVPGTAGQIIIGSNVGDLCIRSENGVVRFGDGNTIFGAFDSTRLVPAPTNTLSLGASGNRWATTYTGSVDASGNITAYSSDKRLKKAIKQYNGDIIDLLEVVEFEWSKSAIRKLFPEFVPDAPKEVGVIAQQIEKVYPIAVRTRKEDAKIKTISWDKITPLLLAEVQRLRKRVAALEA